tara:strand:- start:401 stop:625 length:225 start_codon:yes stop_codon:yes gene_type:complete
MNIEAEKLGLIQWLTQLTDETVIKKIIAIRGEKTDWWDAIDEDERKEIEEGIKQADSGELTSHEEVMAKYKKWL